MADITRLENAKAMRAMGMPLDTKVIEKKLSAAANKKLLAVYKATAALGNAVARWALKQTRRNYSAVCRALDDLYLALRRVDKWIDASNDPEAIAVAGFIHPHILVHDQWTDILNDLEDGE